MRRLREIACVGTFLFALPHISAAQEPPPLLPRITLDVRGTFPRFSTEPELAASRGLRPIELPSRGFGADLGLNFYLFKWKALTLGVGGQLTFTRGTSSPDTTTQTDARPVIEKFTAITPQVSFNFGDGDGWSYISGGLGPSQRTLIPAGESVTAVDEERLRSVNYGAGARWFVTPHLAFTLDVRWHQINAGTPQLGFPASPRSTLFIAGGGITLK
jgi:hypothetical protein